MTLPTASDYAGVHTVHARLPIVRSLASIGSERDCRSGAWRRAIDRTEAAVQSDAAGPCTTSKSAAGLTAWQNRRSRSLTCLPQRASPMLPPCSSSPKQMPPRSALPMSKRANCRRPSRCAGCSPASPKTQRHGHAPEPSPAGHHGPRRLVRSPRYAFVEAGLGRRSRDRTRPRWNGAARRGGQRTSRPLILSRCADRW